MLPEYALRLLRAVPDAALFVTPAGQVVAANASACEALALPSGRPSNVHLSELIAAPAEKVASLLRDWGRTTEPIPGAFVIGDGALSTQFNCRGSLMVSSTDEHPALLFVRFWRRSDANPFVLLNQKIAELNHEIIRRTSTEDALRRSEAALRDRVNEAEALNRATDAFLATVSHELRTPLHAILGWSTALANPATHAHLGKGLEAIRRNAQAQAKIIDDILDMSRIVSGKMRLETQLIDLAQIIVDAAEVVRPSAIAKKIELTVVKPTESCLLVADPDRLQQAAWNLLSNAVKFTEPGGDVRAEVSREGNRLALLVSDTGQGIEPSFLQFVFDRFKQADGTTTRRAGGLGLGLALVRHIVELHGGTVQAFSQGRGKGTTFKVLLPIRAAIEADTPEPLAPLEPAAPSSSGAVLKGLRLLVIDDEPDARELLATILGHAGAVVEQAGSVSEAIDVLARFVPDVLISDIGMPGEDGYSLMRKLLQRDDARAIPAIALSAYTRAEDRAKALAAGFSTHIGKPVESNALLRTVANLAAAAGRNESAVEP